MSFFRSVFVAVMLASCTPLVMPPVRSLPTSLPSVLQPTSKPVVMASGEPAPYDGALLTEGQLRMLKAQRDWLQGQVSAAYRLGRQEGEIVISAAHRERPWRDRAWMAAGLVMGLLLGYTAAEVTDDRP